MSFDSGARDEAALARVLAERKQDGHFPIGCRTGATFSRFDTTTNTYGFMMRSRHVLPYGSVDIIPVYPGWRLVPAEASVTYPTGVHIGVEPTWGIQNSWGSVGNGANVIRRVQSGITLDHVIPTGGILRPDAVGIRKQPGEAIGLRFYSPVTDGINPIATGRSKLSSESAAAVNNVTDYSWTNGTLGNNAPSIQVPIVILGRAANRRRNPSVAIIGDSNSYGTRSTSDGLALFDILDSDGNSGWIERSLNSKIAFSNFSAPGDRLSYLMNIAGGAGGRRYSRLQSLRSFGYSHILHAFNGTNDVGIPLTLTQIQDLWLNWLDELLGTGAKVWAVTTFPQSGSSDVWATQANQTVSANGVILLGMANWIRSNAISYGCEKVIDIAAKLNPAGDGKWRTDLNATLGTPPTFDGTHMSQAMTEWIASQGVISPSMFVL